METEPTIHEEPDAITREGIAVTVPVNDPDPSAGTPNQMERPRPAEGYGYPVNTRPKERPSIPSGLSETQLRALLKDKRTAADGAATALASASGTYRAALQELQSHEPYMPQLEYAGKLDELKAQHLPEIGKLERRLRNLADDLQFTARQIAERAGSAPPSLKDEDDQERAATLMGLVQNEVASLSLAELRDKFRHAVAAEDVATMYCMVLALPSRLSRSKTVTDDAGNISRDGTDSERAELRSLITAAKSKLKDTRMAALAKEASTMSQHASKILWDSGARQRASQTYSFVGESDIRIDPRTRKPLDAVPTGPRRR